MGVAVLEGRALVYHGVKTLRWRHSPHDGLQEGRRLVLHLIRDFWPDILAVETAFFARSRNAALLNLLVEEIRAVGMERGVRLLGFAPSTVKKGICGDGRATKYQVAEAVVARYPELKVYLRQNRKWKERYYGNMFDAVAVGIVARLTSSVSVVG